MSNNKSLRIILIALGVASCLYGGVVLVLVSSSHWFNFAGFILGAALILCGAFLEQIKALWQRIHKPVKIIICVLLAALLIHFGAFEAKVISFAHSVPADDAQYVIILGAKVNGTTPSLEFQKRIDAALDFGISHPGAIIICTGGMGTDEDIPESKAAYDYLKAHGIDESRLCKEEKSTSTTENFIYAKEEIAKSFASLMSSKQSAEAYISRAQDLEPSNVVVVSSSFHLYRASLIAQKQGYDTKTMSFLGSQGLKILMPHYYLREYAAYVRELL